MSNTILCSLLVTILLAGCAHQGAVRVDCEGPLRPINAPVPLKEAPVTIVPASPDTSKAGEHHP